MSYGSSSWLWPGNSYKATATEKPSCRSEAALSIKIIKIIHFHSNHLENITTYQGSSKYYINDLPNSNCIVLYVTYTSSICALHWWPVPVLWYPMQGSGALHWCPVHCAGALCQCSDAQCSALVPCTECCTANACAALQCLQMPVLRCKYKCCTAMLHCNAGKSMPANASAALQTQVLHCRCQCCTANASAALQMAVLHYKCQCCTRSEERRVGQECRPRWSPYH